MLSTITTNELDKIKEMYQSGLGATAISKQIGRSETFVKYNLKKIGISIRKVENGEYRKYTLNKNYFDNINTQEKAYWLGFLFADGYNHEKRGEVKLTLNTKDKHHIEKFLKVIKSNQPIKQFNQDKIKDTCTTVICNKHFSQSLAKIGCVQDKSLHLIFPKLDDKYIQSFMLGYFDGDGCISIIKEKNVQFSVTSSYDFSTKYQQILVEKCNLNKTKLYDRWKDGRALRSHSWTTRYSGSGNIKKIYLFLYKYSNELTPLIRKKDKFDKIINSRPSE